MIKKRALTTRLYTMIGIALLPLLCYGFYKNGISLYTKGYVDFLGMLKPLIIVAMAISGSVVGTILREFKNNKSISQNIINKCKSGIIESFILSLVLPLSTSPIILFMVTFIFSLLFYYLKVNKIALMYLIMQGINYVLGLNSFQNPYELSTVLNYDGSDLFFGLGVGGVASTSVIILVVALIFLSFNKLYKKDMVYSAIVTFLFLGIVPCLVTGNYGDIFPLIFGYNILYTFIMVAPNIYSTSYTSKGQVLSGIILGIVTYFLAIFTPYNAAMLACLLIGFIKGICDRLFVVR